MCSTSTPFSFGTYIAHYVNVQYTEQFTDQLTTYQDYYDTCADSVYQAIFSPPQRMAWGQG